MSSGALLRYLNRTMWFSAALLPNVTWEAIRDSSAHTTLPDAEQLVSAVFEFDDRKRLVTMTTGRLNGAIYGDLWRIPLIQRRRTVPITEI